MAVRREKAERLADEELMPLVGRKDPEAFEVLYDRHGGVAYSLAYRIVGDRAAAEEVTQEAFISIWRSGARFDAARGSVRSWLLSVVRNRAIDFLRSRPARRRSSTSTTTRCSSSGRRRSGPRRRRCGARPRARCAARSASCPASSRR